MATMVDPQLTLLGCPLEIRHEIFGWVCEHEDGPKNLLRNWFGRREIKYNAANGLPAPIPMDDYEAQDEEEDEDNGDGEGEGEDEDDDEIAEDDGTDVDGTGDGTTAAANATVTATTTTTTPAAPNPSRKWRHVPNLMSLTACPPNLALLQTNKQLNAEATDYYYDTVTLKINCTASFNHQAYFEELMDTLADTAFSPAESVRKVELTVVWDSEFVRAVDVTFAEIFLAFLNERAIRVSNVLKQMPSLKELRIVWHDSIKDDESLMVRENIMDQFYGLLDRAELKLEDHYDLGEGTEPNENSVLGQMRLQLEEMKEAFATDKPF